MPRKRATCGSSSRKTDGARSRTDCQSAGACSGSGCTSGAALVDMIHVPYQPLRAKPQAAKIRGCGVSRRLGSPVRDGFAGTLVEAAAERVVLAQHLQEAILQLAAAQVEAAQAPAVL